MIKQIAYALAFAAAIIALALGLKYAQGAGIVGSGAADRIMQTVIGLALAAYANVMPKQLGPSRASPRAEAVAQAALRVGGWSFTLAGLAYAALWAFAPLTFADIASMVVVIAAMAMTIGYAVWTGATCRLTRPATHI